MLSDKNDPKHAPVVSIACLAISDKARYEQVFSALIIPKLKPRKNEEYHPF